MQTVKCKEQGCDKEIVFIHDPEYGVLESKVDTKIKKEVWLTCEDSHTHQYLLEV